MWRLSPRRIARVFGLSVLAFCCLTWMSTRDIHQGSNHSGSPELGIGDSFPVNGQSYGWELPQSSSNYLNNWTEVSVILTSGLTYPIERLIQLRDRYLERVKVTHQDLKTELYILKLNPSFFQLIETIK